MKHLSEYRDPQRIAALTEAIGRQVSRPWTLMEVCGGQTHSIVKHGLEQLLPQQLQLIHGPGCPVCVTPAGSIDDAVRIAGLDRLIFCSYGDMLRVPGSDCSLLDAKARGADVRLVYSPMDTVELARDNPGQLVVFFAVGFETTAPATALALQNARHLGLDNFRVLLAHFLVPPAIASIAGSVNSQVQAFLAPGHVCAVSGTAAYAALCEQHRLPIAITGFEPADILQGVLDCVQQLESGRAELCNSYRRVVRDTGNPLAQQAVDEVFAVARQEWRGIGHLDHSGLALRTDYRSFDAGALLPGGIESGAGDGDCIAGDILLGRKKPPQCPHFGNRCRPEHPLGAPMVSSEGACAAYFHYRPDLN